MTTHLITPSREAVRELAKQGNLIPVSTDLIAYAETPISAFQKLDRGGHTFMLESAENSDEGGRYSFVGTDPRILFQARGRNVTVTEYGEVREFLSEGDPLHELEKLMTRFQPVAMPGLPRWGSRGLYVL